MIATLQFSIPEEQELFDNALDGEHRRAAIAEFFAEMRTAIKYSEAWSPDQITALEYARTAMIDALYSRGISID